jgi:hypothetical protein
MFSFVNGIMLAGALDNLGTLNRDGTLLKAASDQPFSVESAGIDPRNLAQDLREFARV